MMPTMPLLCYILPRMSRLGILTVGLLAASCTVPSLILPQREEPTLEYRLPALRPPTARFRVTGYLPTYRLHAVDPARLEYLTDLVFFAAEPLPDGTVRVKRLKDPTWRALHRRALTLGLRVHLGIKDLGDLPQDRSLATIASRPDLRHSLVRDLLSHALEEGFHGVDVDWEYPRGASMEHFTHLLQELKEEFAPYGLELSAAVSPFVLPPSQALAAVDQIHLMSYDDRGEHSSLERTRLHLERILRLAPPGKVLLGIPFYGRIPSDSGLGPALSWKDLVRIHDPHPNWDTVAGYSYNGPRTVFEKTLLARRKGLGGVMVWEIGQDDPGHRSLLAVIHQAWWAYSPRTALTRQP